MLWGRACSCAGELACRRTGSTRGWFLVEQIAYLDTDDEDRIRHLSLLCSGYLPETADG